MIDGAVVCRQIGWGRANPPRRYIATPPRRGGQTLWPLKFYYYTKLSTAHMMTSSPSPMTSSRSAKNLQKHVGLLLQLDALLPHQPVAGPAI